MSDSVDPENLRVTDNVYTAGRDAFEAGASVLENPWPGTGHIGRAWFAGWLDALGDRSDGGRRAARAYPHLVADDRAELF
ncbi:hypothetical protein GCM10009416_31350 [Craurococcus roseus]|uniref:Uncharacterized protein n=1 Tax=Craurococcus roseus TaxID=77585 RepID=A0ABP3QGJ4_9PROT